MEEQVSEPAGIFHKRSSSNILSDPRILEHLRIVAEEAQSLDKDNEDAESEFETNRRELAEKVAAYNKNNQGAFRLILREVRNGCSPLISELSLNMYPLSRCCSVSASGGSTAIKPSLLIFLARIRLECW